VLSVKTIAWERSFQLDNMMRHRLETIMNWPEEIRKLVRIDAGRPPHSQGD
jgi:hypothetical protein